jgi:hypothetical protein
MTKLFEDEFQIRPPDGIRDGWKHLIPHGCEAPDELREPGWSSHEPPVDVLAAVPPTTDVDPTNSGNRPHGPFDSRQQDAERTRKLVGKVARLGKVLTRLEQDNDREPTRVRWSEQTPAFVRPQIVIIRRSAAMAVNATCAAPRRVLVGWATQCTRAHLSVEWERVPAFNLRHAQRSSDPLVKLVRRFRHGSILGRRARVRCERELAEVFL